MLQTELFLCMQNKKNRMKSLWIEPHSGGFTRHGSRGRTWLAVAVLVDGQHSELVADSVA